jgi:hypothetical protein
LKPRRGDLGTTLIAALVLAVSARRANGATDTVARLEYQADEPEGCAGEDDLRRMVTDQLGHDPFRPDAEQRVAINITKVDGGFQGRIVWTEADGRPIGQRLLTSRSRDCHEIAANVAFAVALQLQLVDRAASSDAGVAPPSTAPPPKTVDDGKRAAAIAERPAGPTEAPGPAPRTRLQLAVGAGPELGIAMAPQPTAFGRLFVAARLGRVSGEIAADAALPATQQEPDGTGGVVNALGSSVAGCGHLSVASACLIGRLGWIRARGFGVTMPAVSWGRFGELGARVAADRALGRFIVSVHADALVMLSRWNVVLSDAVVWSVPRVGGVVGLDVALRFF